MYTPSWWYCAGNAVVPETDRDGVVMSGIAAAPPVELWACPRCKSRIPHPLSAFLLPSNCCACPFPPLATHHSCPPCSPLLSSWWRDKFSSTMVLKSTLCLPFRPSPSLPLSPQASLATPWRSCSAWQGAASASPVPPGGAPQQVVIQSFRPCGVRGCAGVGVAVVWGVHGQVSRGWMMMACARTQDW